MKLFADCADLTVMEGLRDRVEGYTTNPTLMRAAGVTDYETWAREVVNRFPDHSLSFEVIADDLSTIETQANRIASWGENVYAKVPISLTNGTPTADLIWTLAADGVKVNVTAVMTIDQVSEAQEALRGGALAYVSVFMGRIADAGVEFDSELETYLVDFGPPNVSTIWASAREVLNIRQAESRGFQIITLSPELIAKADRTLGKDLTDFSRETVQQFRDDAVAAGLTL